MNYRNWLRATEASTRRREPAGHEEAAQNFRTHLTSREQMALAREIADTRAPELCRAYRTVVDVAYGYKTYRVGKPQQMAGAKSVRRGSGGETTRRIKRVACVKFVVKRKWKHGEEDLDQSLPRYLYAYYSTPAGRLLCAVPTDVDDASVHAGFEPQSGVEIKVNTDTHGDFGTITCGIHRRGFEGSDFALSCRHVFSLSKLVHPARVLSANVSLDNAARVTLGETLNVMGALNDTNSDCLDAQLALVLDRDALREALGNLHFSTFARSEDDVPDIFVVVTATRMIRASLLGYVRTAVPYGRPGIEHVKHTSLILSRLDSPAVGGNSGAPLISSDGQQRLLGMHIAFKANERLSLSIPAWHLLDPARYGQASTESWSLFNP